MLTDVGRLTATKGVEDSGAFAFDANGVAFLIPVIRDTLVGPMTTGTQFRILATDQTPVWLTNQVLDTSNIVSSPFRTLTASYLTHIR